MNATDALVLNYLSARAGFTANQIDHLLGWWRAAREGFEPLCGFLHRQQLLSESTVQLFRQIAVGHLAGALGYSLLDPRELEDFRRRLPDVAMADDDTCIPETMTLLAARDTGDFERTAALAKAEPPRIGTMLGRYLLTEWIGQGASGAVFRALHPTLQIPVAIKVLHRPANEPADIIQLRAEARLLALLNHPNVVRLYDFEADLNYPFLVLENVNGPNLAELIEHCGRLQPARTIRLAKQLANALAAAHRLGIIHRDIKPANVLFTRHGEVKLADLGLAAVVTDFGPAKYGPTPVDARVGTANYIAPEIISSTSTPDERCDIYSLGATLYHALTGRPPFRADSIWQVIERQANCPPPCPREHVPDLPAELSELVMRMMAKNPADRPRSVEELQREPALNAQMADPSSVADSSGSSLWRRMIEKLRGREARRQSA